MEYMCINPISGNKIIKFYRDLFLETNTSYGMFLYPRTFSPFKNKELILPLPFAHIIDTKPMQKSNGKIQTAYSYKSHPRMTVTRLDHMIFSQSLGVDLLIILEEKGYKIDYQTKIAFLIFLLTHDIGHGPFSHPFEQMVDGCKGMHEDIGKRAIKDTKKITAILENIFQGLTDRVTNFKKYDTYGLYTLLEGIFDLDRAAFLIMDTYLMEGKQEEYKQIVSSIYRIFENIILKDGKVYFDIKSFKDIDYFLKLRKENYQNVYQEPKRVLSDLVLKRIGERLLEYKETDEYKEKLSTLPANIANEIIAFESFINQMKKEKSDINLNSYYSFVDNDFNRVFNLLLLLNDEKLNRDCLIMLSPIDVYEKYYQIERNVPKTGKEDFYIVNKFTIYKSTPEENITFMTPDGQLIDYNNCEGRFTNESEFREILSYTLKEVPTLEDEESIRANLIEQLNDLVIYEKLNIQALTPKEEYPADKDVIEQINLYLSSLEKGLTIQEHCELYNIKEYQVITYLLMYYNYDTNHIDEEIRNICRILLSDNIARLINLQTKELNIKYKRLT